MLKGFRDSWRLDRRFGATSDEGDYRELIEYLCALDVWFMSMARAP